MKLRQMFHDLTIATAYMDNGEMDHCQKEAVKLIEKVQTEIFREMEKNKKKQSKWRKQNE